MSVRFAAAISRVSGVLHGRRGRAGPVTPPRGHPARCNFWPDPCPFATNQVRDNLQRRSSATHVIVRLIFVALVLDAGCARPSQYMGLPAPNPNGCYVAVFEEPSFRGIGDVFNGPGRWPRLNAMREVNPNGWSNRIRSLRVGAAARVAVYTENEFKGRSEKYGANIERPRLDSPFSGQIKALEVTCHP